MAEKKAEKIIFQFGKLPYQQEAVDSVVNLFQGVNRVQDGIYKQDRTRKIGETDPVRNESIITSSRLLENLQAVQMNSKLFTDNALKETDYNFTVEMETGTGKTYVYLQTILELNKQYGIKKFLIVVPSVAIRKGIEKSIEQLSEHFVRLDYKDLTKHSMIYDSNHLSSIQSNFVQRDDLSICIMNIQAFNKATNKIREEDEYGTVVWNEIKYIQPVIIIDEPQKIEGQKGKKSQSLKALDDLNPLFTLRYSATHKNLYHPVYKLDSYQAYEKDLVKKIEVKTVNSLVGKEQPYVRYLSFTKECKARIEIFYQQQGKLTKFKTFTVGANDSLEELSGGLPQYRDMRIIESPHKQKPLRISTDTQQEIHLALGTSNFDDEDSAIRFQIRISIENHFQKQFQLLKSGKKDSAKIKAITLFFVDSVAHVRDETQEDGRGEFLQIFDEEYAKAIKKHGKDLEKYKEYFPEYQDVLKVREGYFACDKKNKVVEIEDWDSAKDDLSVKAKSQEDIDRGISLILEKKDELISFSEPLSFIFSHSALREGWDNPNVFTLCTLKKGSSDIAKKQEIGRGLRLPVDTNGVRSKDVALNVLTVVANDSYDNFSRTLQNDFNSSMNHNKNEVTADVLWDTLKSSGIPEKKVTPALMESFKTELLQSGIMDAKFQLNDSPEELLQKLETVDFKNETLNEHKAMLMPQFIKHMKDKGTKRIEVTNGDNEPILNEVRAFVTEDEFREAYNTLCESLLARTVYHCEIDSGEFIKDCIKDFNLYLEAYRTKRQVEVTEAKAGFNTSRSFEMTKEKSSIKYADDELYVETRPVFAIVNDIMRHTMLPRLAIFKMIQGLDKPEMLSSQDVLDTIIQKIIKKVKDLESEKVYEYEVIDGYKLNENRIFGTDTIDDEDGNDNMGEAWKIFKSDTNKRKAMNTYYKMDSQGEFEFAKQLEDDDSVIMFTKLKKGGFVIDTPQGNYSPDWAVVCNEQEDGGNCIAVYFVVETKFSKEKKDLSDVEKWKIACGVLHFKAVSQVIKFDWVNGYEDFQEKFKVGK